MYPWFLSSVSVYTITSSKERRQGEEMAGRDRHMPGEIDGGGPARVGEDRTLMNRFHKPPRVKTKTQTCALPNSGLCGKEEEKKHNKKKIHILNTKILHDVLRHERVFHCILPL